MDLSLPLIGLLALAGGSPMHATHLRCEYLVNPMGIDTPQPRFFWELQSAQRGEVQARYRISVASRPDRLRSDPDLWDSGVVKSSDSIQIPYAGRRLHSGEKAYWQVQVWDGDGYGRPSVSQVATFEMGLLQKSDWAAKWIGAPVPAAPPVEGTDAHWIWYPEGDPSVDAPSGDRYFHFKFNEAGSDFFGEMDVAGDDSFEVWLNAQNLGRGNGVGTFARFNLQYALRQGPNEIIIRAHNDSSRAGLLVGGALTSSQKGTAYNFHRSIASGTNWTVSKTMGGEAVPAMDLGDKGDQVFGHPKSITAPNPATLVRHDFQVTRPIRSARLYASAKGLYEAYLNGKKVSSADFTPGWTDYHHRTQYQTYDVTSMLKHGPNAIGMILGDGWYCGNVAWAGRQNYGLRPMGLAQLVIDYTNGTRQIVASGPNWSRVDGPILDDDLLMGESYDARRSSKNWSRPGYSGPTLEVDSEPIGDINLVAQRDPMCAQLATIHPVKRTQPKPGVFVFDLGQNMVGHVRLQVRGPKGQMVTLRHAEMLNPDGTIYVTNLRGARAIDHYILAGSGAESWEPRFTFHGFRYVEVTGYPGTPGMNAVTGIVVGTNNPVVGSFETSDTLVNKLYHNLFWGERSNYLEVPTDCPQRDERLGWMGDAQIFCRTATFNNDVAAFMTKWTQDVQDGQQNGSFADVSPRIGVGADGSPAWGDAGTIVPWTMYQLYGDSRLIAQRYEAMKKWVDMIDSANPNHIWVKRSGSNYGDWLNLGDDTPRPVIATAYFEHSAEIVRDAAQLLGKATDRVHYSNLASAIKNSYREHFVDTDLKIEGDSQTDYVLALKFHLLKPSEEPQLTDRLVASIQRHKWHLATGFLGCGYLNDVLSDHGRTDVAYRLLLNQDYPGWLYPVVNGATTIWERWDGWTQARGFQDPGMNSFNHYSFGAVGTWMVRVIGGLNYDALAADRQFVIAPQPGGGMTQCRTSFQSERGTAKVEWHLRSGRFVLDVTIPANCTAWVVMPYSLEGASESGRPLAVDQGIEGINPERRSLEIGSGTYRFVAVVSHG